MRQTGFLYPHGHPNGRCPHPPHRIDTSVIDLAGHPRATHRICQDCGTIVDHYVPDDRYQLPLPTIEEAERPTGKAIGMSLEAIIGRLNEIANNGLPFAQAQEINTSLTNAAQEIQNMVSGTGHQEVAAQINALAGQLEQYNLNCLEKAKSQIERIVEQLSSW